ncbi:FliH/SctL family protein [Roseibium sp. RKSG952]|uniref:FliH/SctL family protein n=1 Tax=Roseibium sp. RKSG952 TaxID=2529384 RepID=UPI0012BCA579|nr:FliH/SctL family protein [Roseibium sp. RKSG952]MTH98431.1 flagellar assembly protein FliH [Roseibium sp. RKSG952]
METRGIRKLAANGMTSPSKFLFDLDFSEPEEQETAAPPSPPEVPVIPVAEHRQALKVAREQAFEEGRAAALADLQASQDKLLTDEVVRLAGVAETVLQTLDEHQAGREKDAIGLAFLVARRLCAHLIARQPLAETVALVSECLGPLRKAPHLVIRVPEKDVEALKSRIDPIVQEKGFEGRLVILGEPEIARGDCHIEWADGGIRRDRKAIEREIDASMKAYLQAQAAAAKARQTQRTAAGADG